MNICCRKNDSIWDKIKFLDQWFALFEPNGNARKLANDSDDFFFFPGSVVENDCIDRMGFEGGVDDRVGLHSSGLLLGSEDDKTRWVAVAARTVVPTQFLELSDEPFLLVFPLWEGELGVLVVDFDDSVVKRHLDELVFVGGKMKKRRTVLLVGRWWNEDRKLNCGLLKCTVKRVSHLNQSSLLVLRGGITKIVNVSAEYLFVRKSILILLDWFKISGFSIWFYSFPDIFKWSFRDIKITSIVF